MKIAGGCLFIFGLGLLRTDFIYHSVKGYIISFIAMAAGVILFLVSLRKKNEE